MKQIDFYFDVISPYAYLAFEILPEALLGCSYQINYQPVLLAGLLQHHGQLGPAEIGPKRDWTYRQVQWLAHTHGVELQLPASHPFNPLPLLRLAIACSAHGQPNRHVVESILRHVWCNGLEATDPDRLQVLGGQLAPQRDPQEPAVKAELRRRTDDALALGLFGVPTLRVDGKAFWGLDALPMLRDYLLGGQWFAADAWDGASRVAMGVTRRRSTG